MKKKIVVIITYISLTFFSFMTVSYASDNSDTGTDILIQKVTSYNQQNDVGYFDLLVKPGNQQIVEVAIQNISNSNKEILIELADASTSETGIVDYQKNNHPRDKSLKLAFTDIAKLKQSNFSLKAHQTIKVPIELIIPNISFRGTILGGVTVKQIDNVNNTSKGSLTAGIQNTFSYSLAVKIYQDNKKINPQFLLNAVKEGQINYHNYILANISNSTPTLVKNVNINATIYNEMNEIVYTANAENYEIAPNSNFDYGIDLQGNKFSPGIYRLSLKLTIPNEKNFELKQAFEISKQNAQKYNKSAILMEEKNQKNYLYIILIMVLIVILLVLLFKRHTIVK